MKNRRQVVGSVCAGSIDGRRNTNRHRTRRGTVMLVCILVEAMIALMVLGILSSLKINAATMSAVGQYEQSVYLADSGIQHALSVLESDPAWTGQLEWSDADTSFKSKQISRQYLVSVAATVNGQTVITSEGDFNGNKQSLQVTWTAPEVAPPKNPKKPKKPKNSKAQTNSPPPPKPKKAK